MQKQHTMVIKLVILLLGMDQASSKSNLELTEVDCMEFAEQH